LSSLTRTKQHELKEKFKEHFQELKFVIKKIENCEEELRLNDVRSTQIVVKAIWISIVLMAVSALGIELFRGLGLTAYTVFDEYVTLSLDWIYKTLGLI
jgi:hypothetical protein